MLKDFTKYIKTLQILANSAKFQLILKLRSFRPQIHTINFGGQQIQGIDTDRVESYKIR